MLSGLMSRCMTLWECRNARPCRSKQAEGGRRQRVVPCQSGNAAALRLVVLPSTSAHTACSCPPSHLRRLARRAPQLLVGHAAAEGAGPLRTLGQAAAVAEIHLDVKVASLLPRALLVLHSRRSGKGREVEVRRQEGVLQLRCEGPHSTHRACASAQRSQPCSSTSCANAPRCLGAAAAPPPREFPASHARAAAWNGSAAASA